MLVTKNEALNGIEVSFDTKPSLKVLNALKDNGFRWHKTKCIWYAKMTPQRLEMLNGLENGIVLKPKSNETKKEITNKYGVKVGDIFLLSYGYSMVLYDFFQVVSVTENSCRVVEIVKPYVGGDAYSPRFKAELGKKHEPASNSHWVKDQNKGDLKRIGTYGNGIYISMGNGYYHARPYDGREVEEDHWD